MRLAALLTVVDQHHPPVHHSSGKLAAIALWAASDQADRSAAEHNSGLGIAPGLWGIVAQHGADNDGVHGDLSTVPQQQAVAHDLDALGVMSCTCTSIFIAARPASWHARAKARSNGEALLAELRMRRRPHDGPHVRQVLREN